MFRSYLDHLQEAHMFLVKVTNLRLDGNFIEHCKGFIKKKSY